jgi:hypothetical protein
MLLFRVREPAGEARVADAGLDRFPRLGQTGVSSLYPNCDHRVAPAHLIQVKREWEGPSGKVEL